MIRVPPEQLVMTITKDTVMSNGKQYYIFEYNLPHEILYDSYIKDIFISLDPVRMDEKGYIYVYDDSTQNEYLYIDFPEYFDPYGGIWVSANIGGTKLVKGYAVILSHITFLFKNNVGMISSYIGWDWGCSIQWPCEPFFNQLNILVYAIIDGEKVYSIEDDWEYLAYIRTNDINSTKTYPQ